MNPMYRNIYSIIERIPFGRVATYGQIALAGIPGHARQVGYALYRTDSGCGIPWHRVVNAHGAISRRSFAGDEMVQRKRLEAEGVVFDHRGRVCLSRFQWRGFSEQTEPHRDLV
ncbi:MAG TPA: methyltransferase [bacterium]|nr:methyltransferase [bacterium]